MIVNNVINFRQPNFTANVMPKNCAEYIDNKLKTAKTVDIFCHNSSDEDTFNSAKAMYSYLQSNGIKPRIIVSDGRECYKYDTAKYNIIQDNEVDDKTQKADMALCVDFSASNRVSSKVLDYIRSYGENVVGFDHHNNPDKITPNYNQITQSYAKIQEMPKLEAKNFYIDSSAKSNSAIISRFFDAVGHKMTNKEGQFLLAGMMDDTMKDGLLRVSSIGKISIKENIDDCGNTKSVMDNVLSKLNVLDRLNVLKHFENKGKLTQKEINFQKKLQENTKYSKNGKFAYIEIPQNDKDWELIGRDSFRVKVLLGKYRKKMLKRDDISAVAVFYPSNQNVYKMSIQSKENFAKQIIDNIKSTSCPELVAGGHDDRSGGLLESSDNTQCHNWVNLFVDSADKLLK